MNRHLAPKRPPLPRAEIDWPAYFREFCRAHEVRGGGPVVDGGVLLFGDGWRYALDYRGPEFPPPDRLDDLLALQRRYWRRRLEIVRGERDALAFRVEGLNNARREWTGAPLQVRRYVLDDLGRERVDPDEPVTELTAEVWQPLLDRLRWLAADAAACEKELLALGEPV